MSDWQELCRKPAGLRDGPAIEAWFDRIATRLLNETDVVIAGEPHRFIEIEFYYNAAEHADPFTHRDPLQRTCGLWYFHRTGGMYRSGSFKGHDLTFGDGTAFGGVLIRGLARADGSVIDGPSLCVDHLLARTGARDVADLDERIAARPAWDAGNPILLRPAATPRQQKLERCGRVGLTLKKSKPTSEAPRFVLRSYRYLSEPRQTAKGKLLLVLGLHRQGKSPDEIRAITGSPPGTIKRYIADYQEGLKLNDFTSYCGMELGPKELARLHGTWQRVYGEGEQGG
jgi:hypothetical protein